MDKLPTPSQQTLAVRIQPAGERAIRQGHPWLFANSIRSVSDNGRSGDVAVIFDRKNRFLAVGLYDAESPVRVRILHQGSPAKINADWFAQKVRAALAIRAHLPKQQTTGYRLVHGENDGFGGLVIDRYAKTAVFKLYSLAWLPHLRVILTALKEQLPIETAVLRLSRNIMEPVADRFDLHDGDVLWVDREETAVSEHVTFTENGLSFIANVRKGQKTGFFLDQRENRALVQTMTKGKSVLNVFAHSGGFSVYALRGSAHHVTSLDISQPALALAEQHVALNGFESARHETACGDAFDLLAAYVQAKRRFDMVIIDPPSFAKRQSEVERALGAYGRLARLGIQLLAKKGILVMASCSSRVSAKQFFELVNDAGWAVKRPLTEIKRTAHAIDHPITFKESAYLKCLFAHVD